jgi:hypothetical protein
MESHLCAPSCVTCNISYVFWRVLSSGVFRSSPIFWRNIRLHLQVKGVSQAMIYLEARCRHILLPWRWRQHVPLKHWQHFPHPRHVRLLWEVLSCGMWRCVVRWKSTYVSDEHIASIFRVEESAEQDTSVKAHGKTEASLAYSLTLMMEAISSSETSVDFQWTGLHYIPEDSKYSSM